MNQRLIGVFLGAFLVLVAMCGCVSALEFTIGTPSASETGDSFEIPVILKNDLDFAGFTCEVGNLVNGANITLSDAKPLKDFTYFSNNNEENPFQRIFAYSLGYTTDPELHLFTVKVQVTDPTVTNLPVFNISLREVLQDSGDFYALDNVVTPGLTTVQLKDGLTANIVVEAAERLIPELVVPTLPTPIPTETSGSSPGFGLGLVIAGLGAVAVLLKRKVN